MKKLTEQNLINAFGSESHSHLRYLCFANQADAEEFPHIARLFRAIAFSESVQAHNHYQALRHLEGGFVSNSMAIFGPGDTKRNLLSAVMGKDYVITEMYPAYIEIAQLQGEREAGRSFTWAYLTEKMHRKLFWKAQESIHGKRSDLIIGPIRVCAICGFTRVGEIPNKCPVCKATSENFTTFV